MAKEKNVPEFQEELEADGLETRVYELGFHLDPELPQEEVKKAYQGIHDRISALGTIVAEGEPTKIPLAYTIYRSETTGRRDFDTAFFCWIAYEVNGAGHDEINTMAREDSRIVRFLDIRTTKDAAKHSAEMQEIFAQNAQAAAQQQAEDDAADAAEVAEPAEVVEAPREEEAA